MLEGGSNVIGEVAVDVYGNVDRLEKDFNRARAEAKNFDRDLKGLEKDIIGYSQAVGKAGSEVEQLAKAYNPAHAALIKYGRDLEKITRLEKEGLLTKQEATEYTKRASEAFLEAGKAQDNLAKFTDKAKTALKVFAVAALAAAATGAAALIKSSIEMGKEVTDTARKLGLTTDALQEWRYIAQQSGVEQSALETGFTNLNRAMGKAAAGAKREAELFEHLGISLTDATGAAKSAQQVMPELADALERVEDRNQRAALAQIALGESASEILPALEGGSARIHELADAAQRLGVVLSNEQIQKLDETNQKLEDMKTILSARIAGVVADNADAIIGLANALATVAEKALQAVNAYRQWRMAVGIRAAETTMNSPFATDAQKQSASAKRDALRTALMQSQGRQDKEGAFRDYRAAPLDLGRGSGAGGGAIDASAFLANRGRSRSGGGGRNAVAAARAAERARIRQLRDDVRFANEMASLQTELLRMAGQQSRSAEQRAEIDLKLLDIAKQRFEREMQLEGPAGTGRYTQAEADLMRAKFEEVDRAKRELIELEKREAIRKDRLDLDLSRLENDRELVSLDREIARSRKAQRDLDLELLDLQHDMERARLKAVIASEESTDVEKQIARERMAHLDQIRELQRDIVMREHQGPVADFFDTLKMSSEEVEDALERMRAAKLEDTRQRAVQFADDVGYAFANMTRSVLNLENPLSILRNLLFDLTHIFNEEVLVRPVQEWARNRIGGPLAERVVGAPAGPEGLWMEQLRGSGVAAAMQLDQVALAATRAAQGLSVTVLDGVAPLGQASAESAGELKQHAGTVGQFGGALSQAMAMLSGGVGGNGLLGLGLTVLSSAFGSGPNPALAGNVAATMNAHPGIFHGGGEVGANGLPVRRRRLLPGEVNITAKVGERVIPEGPSRQFRGILDSISEGRIPRLGMWGGGGVGGSISRSTNVSYGDIVVQGARSEREARRTGKQVSAEINRGIARAARQGIRSND